MMTKKMLPSKVAVACGALLLSFVSLRAATLRPPAVPLVACDPYFSIWSPADKLTDADTVHWTGKPNRLGSLLRVDGKGFRLMGKEPAGVPAFPQTNVEVLPTRTIYTFEGEGVRLTLTFLTPALPYDIDVLSRPVTYLTWTAVATDAKEHKVAVYFEASPEVAMNDRKEEVRTVLPAVKGLAVLGVGTVDQPILQKKGDDLRIDWGYFYVAVPGSYHDAVKGQMTQSVSLQANRGETGWAWANNGTVTSNAAPAGFVLEDRLAQTLSVHIDLGTVKNKPVSRWLMLAYDDEFSIQYMKKNLRPYWRRNGDDVAELLKKSAADYKSLNKRCEAFDAELMADLTKAGGDKYAQIGALAYRQCFAAGKFVADANGQPLQFCKENHSNGCIGTSDVFYPMAPQFLLLGPTLAKSFLVPFMNYAASDRWKFPFAPHDLGTYPKANGQVYGGGERNELNQMPVEESGNLLILMAAIAEMEGKPDFANLYWPQLQTWAAYLQDKGFDPENQLCTDDFAGHLAHNVNLSAKAICGLGAFAKLCEMRGEKEKAAQYFKIARGFAERWMKEADDGNHYRLAFDKPGTWSQKYNLIWDRILGLNLFPASVAQKEMDYYKTVQNRFGLPLDNRKDYTKLDWITWTATLTQNRADFETLIDPIYTFLNETPNRSPMTDWYDTKTAAKVGFTARPVVGGVFAQMLYDKPVWKKWASRDQTKASKWAPMPDMPQLGTVVPAADAQAATWLYTTNRPGTNWAQPNFDASSWQEGKSGFGTSDTPGASVGTIWNGPDIWLRREIELPRRDLSNLIAWLHHDEDAEVFVNGVLALRARGFSTGYEAVDFNGRGSAAFKRGKNLIAIHCRQTTGGQYIDFGLAESKGN